MTMLNCTQHSEEEVICNGKLYDLPEEKLTYHHTMFWVYIGVYTGLVLFAGLMSGLTMGLLSLDQTTLLTLKDGGTPTEKKHAKRILPVVKRHHLLLVTLLLANAVAVEAMPIFLDKVSNPIIAIVISVTAVLIFGEVIPQAVCTRYGLAIGSYLTPLVYFMMGAFFIIAYPLAKVLDCMLGDDHGTFYRRGQLKALIDIHGEEGGEGSEHGRGGEALSKDEVSIIKGALDMRNKTAQDAMVAIDQVYMLSLDARLDSDTMSQVMEKGHSRIPIYGCDRSNIMALVLTKTLIKFDPEDAVAITEVVSESQYAREALFIESDMPLFDLLNVFQTGRSHLAFIRKAKESKLKADTKYVPEDHTEATPLLINISDEDAVDPPKEGDIIGIITLEDVIEELLQEEIDDELDVSIDMSRKLQLSMVRLRRKSATHGPQKSSP